MWFEILPSFAVVLGCLAFPQVYAYVSNKLFLGNGYQRKMVTGYDAYMYLRDTRVSGCDDPYKQVGLENLSLGEEEGKK